MLGLSQTLGTFERWVILNAAHACCKNFAGTQYLFSFADLSCFLSLFHYFLLTITIILQSPIYTIA
jgi:hypothetical protein